MQDASSAKGKKAITSLPILVEQDEDGFYIVECPILPGCYTQGETMDEALANIEEVISLLCEEEECREIIANYTPQNISFQTISIDLND